ncbi:MAG: L,D-transpeptidase [Anaerolineales bacterium]
MKKRLFPLILFALVVSLLPAFPATAQTALAFDDDVLCPPDVYFSDPGNCLPLGPSQTLTERARDGFPHSPRPFLAMSRDESLSRVPYQYYRITEYTTNTYATLEDAQNKTNPLRQIGPGEALFVTYLRMERTNRGVYFLLSSGEWMPGDGERHTPPAVFRGLEFVQPPQSPFGWAIFELDVRAEPGYRADIAVVRNLRKHELVHIYGSTTVLNEEWLSIGPGEWVPAQRVAVVYPKTTPPDGVTNGRWIDIDNAEQVLAVYENNQMVFAAMAATGFDPFWTRTGLFQVYKMLEAGPMQGSFEIDRSDFYFLDQVPYTLYYDKARAIHGVYWRASLGFEQSKGCVNLSIGDAAWVYFWANEGDWVYVHDRSGNTPTDPALFGDGGA